MAVGVAVGATVVSLYAFGKLTKKKKKSKKRFLTKEQLCKVFDSLVEKIIEVLRRIAAQEKMVTQNYAAAGKTISIDEMYQFCQQRLEEEMASAEPEVYNKHNTTEAAVAAAVAKFEDDLEVKERVKRFQQLAMQVRKPKAEVPAHLTEKIFIELMTEMMENITKAMEATVEAVKSKGGTPKSPEFNQAMAMQFQPAVQAISSSVMSKYNITEEIFTTAMSKFQESDTFKDALTKLTNDQHDRFTAMGVSSD